MYIHTSYINIQKLSRKYMLEKPNWNILLSKGIGWKLYGNYFNLYSDWRFLRLIGSGTNSMELKFIFIRPLALQDSEEQL